MFTTRVQRPAFGRRLILALLLMPALAFSVVAGCGREENDALARPDHRDGVVVSIFPLYDLTKRLTGEDISVRLILPPGVSEHGYSPSAADIRALDNAALLVVNGGGDDWYASAYRRRAWDGLRLVNLMHLLGEDLDAWNVEVHGDDHHDCDDHDHHHHDHGEECDHHGEDCDHHHHHGDVNPHQWLVPRNMSRLVAKVSEELQSLYPQHAERIRERETAIHFDMAELEVEHEDALTPFTDRRIVTFHDAFDPLAEAFGLTVVASLLDMHTLEATPARVLEVKRQIEKEGVRAVFIEPQFDSRAAQGLTGAGVTLRTLDPLGDPGREGYDSYVAMMRSNLEQLVAGLQDNERNHR